MKPAYIAVDFGAGSGRVIAGIPDADGSITFDEVYRFDNRRVRLGRHIYWDFPALFADMTEGLRRCVAKGYRLTSVGVDTWGVDFGFIDRRGNLSGNPVSYRDPSCSGGVDRYFASRDIAAHYAGTGIQMMDINSLYRLADMRQSDPDILEGADRLLFMPDLFNYFLTGVACCEYTEATTSELIDARTRSWNMETIRSAGFPERLFGRIVMPGEIIGVLTDAMMEEIGVDYAVPVVAVASHDTASAVESVKPFSDGCGAFLSCGTWSLLGVVIDTPILTEQARKAGFTNEGAAGGRICFLQNITGLWILQRLMDQWDCHDYGTLIAEAEQSPLTAIIDVDSPDFTNPADMAAAITGYCRRHCLEVPASRGDFVRCVLLSLADRYRRGIEGLDAILPQKVRSLTIFGGGSRNSLLLDLTARATGIEIIRGITEATAYGNIITQQKALG